jgi:hypothetical protein
MGARFKYSEWDTWENFMHITCYEYPESLILDAS